MSTKVSITISAKDKASKVISDIKTQLKQLQAVSGGSSGGNGGDKVNIKATEQGLNSTTKAITALSGKLINFAAATAFAKKAGKTLFSFIDESARWIENLNLFTVTFGSAADGVMDFALNLSRTLGMSANEIIRFTGLFKQMAEAIGVTEQASTDMSMALTALGYDLAAFYNITTESAMEKIRAGLAGQTKPLRQLGMDITAQSLDKYLADKMGLQYTSKQLSQSDKVLLRTIIMLEQAKNAYGEMAKTVNSYENQIKILRGSVDNLKLAIGDFLVSDATNIIKYVNGAIIAMTNLLRMFTPFVTKSPYEDTAKSPAEELAELKKTYPDFEKWVELPQNAGKSFEDWADEVDGLNKSIDKLSFDKFETLTKSSSKISIGGLLETEMYRKQTEYMDEFNKRLKETENNANKVAASILGWMFPDFAKSELDFAEWAKTAENPLKELNFTIKAIAQTLKLIVAFKISSMLMQLPTMLITVGNAVAGVSASTLGLRTALSSLSAVAMIWLTIDLVTKWNELDKVGKAWRITLIALAAALFVLKSGMLETLGITALYAVDALKKLIATLGSVTAATWTLVAGMAALTAGFIVLAINWEDMGKWQKVITIFSALAAAALTAALAVGVFHTSWSLGLGAAAIAAGIALVVGSIASVKSIKTFAGGGVPERGSMFIAGEAGAELVYNMNGGGTGVSNVQQLQQATAGALREVIAPILYDIANSLHTQSRGNGDVYIDGEKVTATVYKSGKRVGYWK